MAIFLGSSGNDILASKGATELLEFFRNQATGLLSAAAADSEQNLLLELSHRLDEEIAFEQSAAAGFTASLNDLDRACFADELATAYQRCIAVCEEYYLRRQSIIALHEIAGLAKDRLIVAAATLAANLLQLEADLPPASRFGILASGSSGRREQTFRSSGCYFLIHEGTDETSRDYFIRLKFQILALLRECGCAVTPDSDGLGDYLWTGTLPTWRKHVADAGKEPFSGTRATLHLPGFFHTMDDETVPHHLELLADLRTVTGAPDLLAAGMEQSRGLVAESWQTPTGRGLARRATSLPLPIGMFGGYRVERGGEHRGAFNLDQLAITPLVSTLRWLALSAGISETGTVARIKGLLAKRALDVELSERLLQAYQLFTRQKILFELSSTGETTPYVYPDQLSEVDASGLRNGLDTVQTIQKLLYVKLTEEG